MDDILIKNHTKIESFIKELAEDELVYLNKLVVERIKYLRLVVRKLIWSEASFLLGYVSHLVTTPLLLGYAP